MKPQASRGALLADREQRMRTAGLAVGLVRPRCGVQGGVEVNSAAAAAERHESWRLLEHDLEPLVLAMARLVQHPSVIQQRRAPVTAGWGG